MTRKEKTLCGSQVHMWNPRSQGQPKNGLEVRDNQKMASGCLWAIFVLDSDPSGYLFSNGAGLSRDPQGCEER